MPQDRSSEQEPAPPGAPPSLRRTVLAAGSWLFALRLVERLLGVARMIVLARLLAPDDFGLFGIAMLAMSVIETASQTGFNEAIIQQRRPASDYLGTAWSVHLVRGAALAVALWAVAPLVAAFFREPTAVPLLRALCLNLLLVGAANTGVVLLQKDLRFARLTAVSAAATLVDVAVSVIVAVTLRSAWALVYGVLAGNLARVLVSYVVAPAVRPAFDTARLRELAGFGGWVWSAGLLHFAANQGDDVIVGRMLGTPALGVYRMAYAYAGVPATEITHVISRVTFAAYAKLRDDAAGLREGYLRTVRAVALVAAPLSAGIAVMAPSFVRLVLEPIWEPLVLPLQILALWGLLRSLAATTGPVLLALGRPEVVTRLVGMRLLALLALIFPLTARYGVPGTAAAVVLAALIDFPVAAVVAGRLVGYGVRDYVGAWLFPALAAAAMAAVVAAWHAWLANDFGLPVFCASIAGGALLYVTLVVAVGPLFGYRALEPFGK